MLDIDKHKQKKKETINIIAIALIAIVITWYVQRTLFATILAGVISIALVVFYYFTKEKLEETAKIRKMEEIFPDFIELMASNLRAGMTVDAALLLGSRKEFAPLDEEILKVGKEIVTGREISIALMNLSNRIPSEKIKKTINLIISGIKSGGNLAVLLEETAASMREQTFIEKRAASNVLMYVIFIFFASAVGSPALFALSSVLVKILSDLMNELPPVDTSISLPLQLTQISVSQEFILYFSIIFIVTSNVLASLVLGLVNKGQEKAGLKYTLPMIGISIIVYFGMRFLLLSYFGNLF